jgi:hypothetical protein
MEDLIRPGDPDSGAGALEHQLQLTDGGATDIEGSPAGSQKHGGCNKQKPSIHG